MKVTCQTDAWSMHVVAVCRSFTIQLDGILASWNQCERLINPAVPHDYDPLENNSSWRHEEVVGDTTRWWPAVMKHFHWITTETCVVDTCVTAKSSVSTVSAVLACIVVKRTEIFQRSTVAERILILNRQHTHQTRLVMCSNNEQNIGCRTDSHLSTSISYSLSDVLRVGRQLQM